MEFREDCKHEHKISFKDFLGGRHPIGSQVCEHCGRKIHFNWFWQVLYILTGLVPTIPFLILILIQFDHSSSTVLFLLLLVILAGCLEVFLSWLIVNHGKYIANKKQ